jgi:hypothetical protein
MQKLLSRSTRRARVGNVSSSARAVQKSAECSFEDSKAQNSRTSNRSSTKVQLYSSTRELRRANRIKRLRANREINRLCCVLLILGHCCTVQRVLYSVLRCTHDNCALRLVNLAASLITTIKTVKQLVRGAYDLIISGAMCAYARGSNDDSRFLLCT